MGVTNVWVYTRKCKLIVQASSRRGEGIEAFGRQRRRCSGEPALWVQSLLPSRDLRHRIVVSVHLGACANLMYQDWV